MKYLVLALLCLAAMISYVQRQAMNVPATEIQLELGFNKADMGRLMAAWSLGYALMQIPAGWLADRWGERRALALIAVVWSVLTGLASLAWDWRSLTVMWTLMGMAMSGIFPCSAKAIGRWFPETHRARASGLLASSMAVGSAVAPLLCAWLLTQTLIGTAITWRQVCVIVAVPGVLWAGLLLMLTPPVPGQVGSQRSAGSGSDSSAAAVPVDWLRLVSSSSMWVLCGQQFFRAAAMAFFTTWFPTFLRESRGVGQFESGVLSAWTGVGALLGGLSGGWFSDMLLESTGRKRLSRQGIAVMGMAGCALLIVGSWFVADQRQAVLCISMGAFLATFGGVSGYTVAIEFGGRQVATVFSVMNMCGNIGAALFPLIVGLITSPLPGQTASPAGSWDRVLFLCAGIFALDSILWAVLNPRGPLFPALPEVRPAASDELSNS